MENNKKVEKIEISIVEYIEILNVKKTRLKETYKKEIDKLDKEIEELKNKLPRTNKGRRPKIQTQTEEKK